MSRVWTPVAVRRIAALSRVTDGSGALSSSTQDATETRAVDAINSECPDYLRVTMSKSMRISSLTFTVPPAMLMGWMPKSRWRIDKVP